MAYTQVSVDEWQWQSGSKIYHVRRFPRQSTLIWGGRINNPDGIHFDEDIRQTYEQFLDQGAPASHTPHIPAELITALRAALDKPIAPSVPTKKRWWSRKSHTEE